MDSSPSLDLATGSPEGSLIYFLLLTVIGLVLGGIIFGLMAFQGTRREQFRTFGTMPRLGAVVGFLVAATLIGIAWSSVYRDFYHLKLEGNRVILDYRMPPRTVSLSTTEITGMRRTVEIGKITRRRIVLETPNGNYKSGGLTRSDIETYWEKLTPYFKPLD